MTVSFAKKILFLFLFSACFLFGQDKTIVQKDSVKKALSDSTKTADSTKTNKKADIDAVVYSAASDSMIMNVKSKKMQIFGKGNIKYKTTDLKGGKIFVDYNSNELEAYGVPDSTGKKLKDTPVLVDGQQSYDGEKMRYNFKTQQGYITAARQKLKDTRYEGDKVKKVDKETYFIENAMFTTCSEKEPHTYFTASEMKVMTNDKFIARWVFMYIAGIPLPIPLPMAVIPNQTGRRSGIIMPGFGEDNARGLYLSHLGYFLALSDYYDLALTSDLYSRGGYGLKARIRYNKRYEFSGEFNAGFSAIQTDLQNSREWNLSLSHNQKLDPTSNLSAQLQFQSSTDYNKYNTYNYNDLLRQQIISSAQYSKTFEDLNASLSISYNRNQNLAEGTYTENLPSIGFSKSQFYPFKRNSKEGVIDQMWYELIGVNYTATFDNQRTKTKVEGRDSLYSHLGLKHNITINASPKIGYFTVTPSLNYTELWYNKRMEEEEIAYDEAGVTKYKTVRTEKGEFNFVRTFNLSLSASTKLYGILPAGGFLGIDAFRHTIIPTVSYNFTPDFSRNSWGYYGSYKNHLGQEIKYNKFQNEIYGGPTTGETQSITYGIGNIFELKTLKDPTDTTSQSQKVQLLNFSIGSGYNFAREEFKMQELSAQFRTQIGNALEFQGTSNYTFYDSDDNGVLVNRYLASAGKGLFRITNFNLSISTNLSPETFKAAPENKQQGPPVNEGDMTRNVNKGEDLITPIKENSSDYSIPWNLALSFTYNSSSPSSILPSVKSTTINANFSVNLTKKMKITLFGNFDFESRRFSAPQINISRELHCWEMNLRWNPLGNYRGFYFIIRMKAPEFQDIKYEKSEGMYSGRF